MTPIFLIAALSLLSAAAGQAVPGTQPTVTVSGGPVAGTSVGSVNQFLGIPFAASPTRFNPPQPAPTWQGTLDATQYKPACVQQFNYPENARNNTIQWFSTPGPPAGESEDCLYLNVYAPAGAVAGSNKAVMFWIFGGSFTFGTGTLHQYNGTSFAENQDVIIVTHNYRTNVFGFPGEPEKPTSQQNLGFLDQRLALDWVQRNIRSFGGDPTRVILFGEGAGAQSVDVLVTNPPLPVPFIGAIMESGQDSISTPSTASAQSWPKLVIATNCTTALSALDCVRKVSASDIKSIIEHQQLSFAPIYDNGTTWKGTGRVDRRSSTPANPRIARVPILIGSNADEGSFVVYGVTDVRGTLSQVFPPNSSLLINTLLSLYPPNTGNGTVNTQLAAILNDFLIKCPAKVVSTETAAVGIPAWRHYFDAAFANTQIFPGAGAYHSAEINLVFGTYPQAGATPYHIKLSMAMQKAWADFAKNPAQGPGWQAVPKIAIFGAGVRPGGDDGTGKPTSVVTSPNQIDRFCPLYQPIYDARILLSL
ncbi:carboxylesterase family protein [Hirsutella rhossiliensis]|uniref:Carboxylesterase family domain-containing protein n=1 Tax=Hirsutella rhossiliensis TaxID=111463 RepID=A0A9P8N4P7_9HYPO|nr:carboxylesterase family domain-containing protein [Hirsutella rhossiliensis]KAH0965759.1 carboxylesterase family domain-containing protein [Hirsutella rhossiliensis]